MNKSILLAPALALALAGCAGAGHDKPKSYVVHTAPVETVPAPVQPSPQLEAISSGNACPSDIGVPYTFDAEESSTDENQWSMCVYDVTDPAGDAVVLERQWGVEKGEVVLVTLNTIRERVASEGWIVQDLPELGSGAFSATYPANDHTKVDICEVNIPFEDHVLRVYNGATPCHMNLNKKVAAALK